MCLHCDQRVVYKQVTHTRSSPAAKQFILSGVQGLVPLIIVPLREISASPHKTGSANDVTQLLPPGYRILFASASTRSIPKTSFCSRSTYSSREECSHCGSVSKFYNYGSHGLRCAHNARESGTCCQGQLPTNIESAARQRLQLHPQSHPKQARSGRAVDTT